MPANAQVPGGEEGARSVFISYRRDDAKYQAWLIYQLFARVLPPDNLFMDTKIPLEVEFRPTLMEWVQKCDILLALIGPGWVDIKDPTTGRRRLDDEGDLVRVEIRTALQKKGISVVPVLLNETAMPRSDELPEDLQQLSRQQAESVGTRTYGQFVSDVERLIRRLLGGAAPVSVTPSPPILKPGDVFTDIEGVTPEMVVVPAGEFLMGSPDDEEGRFVDEGPQHRMTISQPFAVGRFPVTFAEWDKARELGFDGPRLEDEWGRGRQPVINVSWEEARAYAAWLTRYSGKTYRLLTEAEWEYACRAGSTTRFSFGDGEAGLYQHAWFAGNSGGETHPVGEKVPNAWGLYDMHGNVWEWVHDYWWGPYDATLVATFEGDGMGPLRGYRGGSYSFEARYLRAANRGRNRPRVRSNDLGFRLARTLD